MGLGDLFNSLKGTWSEAKANVFGDRWGDIWIPVAYYEQKFNEGKINRNELLSYIRNYYYKAKDLSYDISNYLCNHKTTLSPNALNDILYYQKQIQDFLSEYKNDF